MPEEEETFLAAPSLFKLLKLSLPAAFSTNTEVSVLDAKSKQPSWESIDHR